MFRHWVAARLWDVVRWAPGTSKTFGPPRRFCTDLKSWIGAQAADRRDHFGYVEVEPSSRADRPDPVTIYASDDWQSQQWYASTRITSPPQDFPAAFVATLPDGRLLGADGAVVTHDDALLAEVSVDLRVANHGHATAHAARHRWVLPPVRRQAGRVASLAVLGGHNYFHWMFHVLPRIELLRRAGLTYDAIDWFAMNKIQHPFQEQTLATMGVPQERVLEVREDDHLQVDMLLVPSRPSRMSDMPWWVCDFLRHSFLPPEDDHTARAEHLYLTREHSPHRNIRNEAEVRQLLEQCGFTTVSPETMSVADQARTLRRAAVVVAPHGAALTNLVFCRPGVTVIEIFNPRYINGCYWMLSSWVGARYHYMLGMGEKPSERDVPFEQYGGLKVDVDALSRLLRLAGV